MTAPQRPDVDPYDGPPPTDLVVEDITVGDGPEAVSGQTVTVHYVGALRCGHGNLRERGRAGPLCQIGPTAPWTA